MQNKLSIIVPIYNEENWIGRCIESLIRQTFNDFEVIIIDDGSTDNSLSIIKKYCQLDKRIKYISTKNQGSAKARNTGLEHINGDLVTFVDADDYIEEQMYETMIDILNTHDADIVECGCRKRNIVGRTIIEYELQNEEIIGNESCIRHFMKQINTRNYMWNKVYKKELFENLEFPALHFSEDYYMNAVLHSKSRKKIVISQIFYNYMIYSGQSTTNLHIQKERIDGIRAGNMVADYYSYSNEFKSYAIIYACEYALFIADNLYKNCPEQLKEFRKLINKELLEALLRLPCWIMKHEENRKIVFRCILLMIFNCYFYDFQWLLEM